MRLTPTTIAVEDLINRHVANAPNVRSEGLHQSDIIKVMMKELEPKRFDKRDKVTGEPLPMDWVKIEAGFAFETILEDGLAARHPNLIRPGEVELDGITGSPDGLDIGTLQLKEYKATWMSSGLDNETVEAARAGVQRAVDLYNDAIQHKKFWHWFVQVKGYLHMLSVTYGYDTFSCELIPFFVMGNYRDSGPQLLSWSIDFTPRELAENWQMLINVGKSKGMFP